MINRKVFEELAKVHIIQNVCRSMFVALVHNFPCMAGFSEPEGQDLKSL